MRLCAQVTLPTTTSLADTKETIESLDTNKNFTSSSLSDRAPGRPCLLISSAPRRTPTHAIQLSTQRAQPCFSSKNSRRPFNCIHHISAHSFDRTYIESCLRKKRARARESSPLYASWTRSISPMDRSFLALAPPNTLFITRRLFGDHIRERWYAVLQDEE